MNATEELLSFLFTDVEGSTQLWEQHTEYMQAALAAHDEILRDAIAAAGGSVFSTAGDAFAAVFESPDHAIAAATEAQIALDCHPWPEGRALRVRMGVHSGPAQRRDDDYFGPTLNRAARLMSAGHGGQTLVSDVARRLAAEVEVQDLGEHRLKDLSEPEQVWQLLIDGLDANFAPLRSLDPMPTNLPTTLASFVGRDTEIADLMSVLADNRLVMVTGVGGVGKTRLTLQVAADASHHYPQGIWFVELAPVQIGDAVPFRFLEALGLDSQPGEQPLGTVAASIGDGAVLMVVDNCEHVLEPVATAVSGLLGACPNLRVLASSRRPLGLNGEQVRAVHPLDVTGADSAATKLFIHRAMAAASELDLGDRVDVITDICARLDGVPLAIELAAARCRSMTPEDLADRLGDRFRLLKRSHTAESEERHRTLRSTIEWSYDLLDDEQKFLLQRLAVFAGSFTLTAAEKVCTDNDLDELRIVDLLTDLVDHSLLVADSSGAATRYRLLDTIREFAVEQLGDHLSELRDRHAHYHGEWAQRLGAALFSTDELAAVDELEAGWSDLRAAVVHATGDLDLFARLLEPLALDAWYRARSETGDWAEVALAAADIHGATDHARAVFLGSAAASRALAGDGAQAVAHGTALVELCDRTNTLVPPAVGAAVTAAALLVDSDLNRRVHELFERGAKASTEPWAASTVEVLRAFQGVFTGQPEIAVEAARLAASLVPDEICPTQRAWIEFGLAVTDTGPVTARISRMELAIELAASVRNHFQANYFGLYLESVRAATGDIAQSMTEAADHLDELPVTEALGLAPHALRSAAGLLIKFGEHELAAQLLGYTEDKPSNAPPEFEAFVERRTAQMRDAIGGDAADTAAAKGATLSIEEVLTLASTALRAAVEELRT